MAEALSHDADIRLAFPDGILWARSGTNPDVVGQLQRWAGLFRLFMPEIGELTKEVIEHVIEDREMLLIIDDVWRIEDALAFQLGGSRCTHLFTTRFPQLALKLSTDDPVHVQELNEEESLDLLHTLAPQIVEQELEKAHTLVQTIGGLPLALSLMGNYLRTHTYGGQTRRIQAALLQLQSHETRLHLDKPLGFFERHPSLLPGQRLSLHSVIAVSDAHMDNEMRQAFYALSVLPPKPDTFSKAAAVTVCSCSLKILDSLVGTGLLEESGDGRYALHQTIADYGQTHLMSTSPQECLIQYAFSFIEAHQADYEQLDQESSTILRALDAAYVLDHQAELIHGVCAFAPFLLLHGNYEVAERHLYRAQQAALALENQQGLVGTYLYLGDLAGKKGDYVQSQSFLEQGLMLARRLEEPERMCALLSLLGRSHWKQGHYSLAEVYLQEGLTFAWKTQHRERMRSELLATLGAIAANLGDYPRSEAYLQEGLKLARKTDDRKHVCTLLMNLGVTISEQGQYEQARVYFEEGLALARQIGHFERISALLCNLGAAATLQGQYAQAEIYQREGLSIARQIGHREWMSILLLNAGETAAAQGKYNQATLYLQQTAKLVKQLGRPQLLARTFYELGNLYLKQQQVKEADAIFCEMLSAIPEGDVELHALSQYAFARICAVQGNMDQARQLGEISAAALESIKHREAEQVRHWLTSIATL
jgi:tetratricopeptide (TPR) repeat protein